MKQVELNGHTYGLEWNMMAQLMLERESDVIGSDQSPILQASLMVWAALHGGNENFDKGPEWALRECGKDYGKWRELLKATTAEFKEFYELNEDILQPADTIPTEGKKSPRKRSSK